MTMQEIRFIAKCRCGCITSVLCLDQDMNRSKNDPHRKGPAGVYSNPMGFHVIDCRDCGKPAHANPVRGRFSAKHVCNAKCLASRSGVCECSCGGKNHGASYAA